MINRTINLILRWMLNEPPLYVALISDSRIHLVGDLTGNEWLSEITDNKFGQLGVPLGYNSVDGTHRRLEETLVNLNRNRIAFLRDYKQGYCPAELMANLQAKKVISDSFYEITWKRPGDWEITEVSNK